MPAGEQTIDQIVLNPLSCCAEHGIKLHLIKEMLSIDRQRRTVTAREGTTAACDRLLLATGSRPFILPVPGKTCCG